MTRLIRRLFRRPSPIARQLQKLARELERKDLPQEMRSAILADYCRLDTVRRLGWPL